MKRNNKKGFTIVELVIVIAVIAILAGVLIPTFAGIVKKANKSGIDQETRAALTVILAEENGQLTTSADYYFFYVNDDKVTYFAYEDKELVEKEDPTALTEWDSANKKIKVDANDVIWYGNATLVDEISIAADAAATNFAKEIPLEDLENIVVVKKLAGTN